MTDEMRLTAKQFRDILTQLNLGRAARQGEQRRAWRLALDAEVEVTGVAAEDRWAARVQNVSSRGICLLQREAMAVGDQFVLHLESDEGRSVDVLCTVQHSQPARGIYQSIGAEFTCTVSPAQEAEQAQIERVRRAMMR